MKYLLVDFGSTYTKLTAVDLEECEILGRAKDITTVEDEVMIGYNRALKKLKEETGEIAFDKVLACSSAAGGLKMISIGLSQKLTVEAGKRTALGAGARILKTYSYDLTDEKLDEIESLDCDIILLSGGTNAGNYRTIIHNASKLAERKIKVPIVVAGNENANDRIKEIFDEAGIEYYITENIMPAVNVLNAIPARKEIRSIFMDKITAAKGIDTMKGQINGVLMPTPAAVLKGASILAKGTDSVEGMGDLIVVDIGGATTDVHSIGKGSVKDPKTRFEGMQEPFEKRTVEGDLGMRYSALSLYEAVGEDKLRKYLGEDRDIFGNCKYRTEHIKMVPQSPEDFEFDEAMAKAAVEFSIKRHCGRLRKEFSNNRYIYYQSGKDLRDTKTIVGTGGVIVHSKNPRCILAALENNKEIQRYLTPENPNYYVDAEYILSAMGLLGMEKPDEAVKIMKKYLKRLEL